NRDNQIGGLKTARKFHSICATEIGKIGAKVATSANIILNRI
ncbi:16392_t:CDS:1, partial [Dentiscutata heterogama]